MTLGLAEKELTAVGPFGPLVGSLAAPQFAGEPVVIVIPGSGPTDRDGNNHLGVRAATYRLLADGLKAEGVASLRIDKRGMFASKAAAPDANAVTVDEYVKDVGAWIDAVRQQTTLGKVFLFGHSEGGLIALAAASRFCERIAGLILAATPGRSLGDVILEQLQASGADDVSIDCAAAVIAALKAGQSYETTNLPQPIAHLFHQSVQGYLTSFLGVDPLFLISQCRLPMLIMQGEWDLQINMTDAQKLKQHSAEAILVILPRTTHVLKQATSQNRAANLATYSDPNLPLAPGLIKTIADFVRANTASL